LSSGVVLALVVAFSLLAFGRGFDYAFGSNAGTRSLVILEALAPMRFWGAALMGGSVALLMSLVFRVNSAVWLSHVYCLALNVCMGISITQAVLHFDGGFTEIVLPLAAALWHGVLVYLTLPFKTREGVSHGPDKSWWAAC
jgi:hypothetical protein